MSSLSENSNRLDTAEATAHSERSDMTARRFASAAHEAIDSAAESAEKVEQKMRAGVAGANEKFEKSHEAASQQLKESIESLDSFLHKRPVAAAGIAFAAGALATALLRR